MRRLRLLAATVAVSAAHAVGLGAEPDTLPEFTVTTHRHAQTIPTQRLDGQRLEALRTHSVADALRYFSGVQIKDYGGVGGLKTINIRSMGSHHTGVFYDGIQLGNAQNGQIDLGRFSLENIEEVSLYNGNKSNIFQGARDYGNAGAVYMRTRRPRVDASRPWRAIGVMRAGSFGLAAPEVTCDLRLNDAVSLTATAAYTRADGRYKFRYRRLNSDNTVAYDTVATRQGGDIEAVRAELAAFGNLRRGMWTSRVYFYDSSRGIPGAVVNNVFRNAEHQWDRSVMVTARTEQALTPRYSLMVTAKYANDYLHYLRDDPRELFVDNRYDQNEFYISQAHLLTLSPQWQANAALDVQYNSMWSDMAAFVFPRRWTVMGAGAVSWTTQRFALQASGLVTHITDHTNLMAAEHRTVFTPAAFVNVQALEGFSRWRLNAFVKESYRMPTFNDLYYAEVGNTRLRPERTLQINAGTGIDFNAGPVQCNATAAAYHNRVTDKIIAYPAGQQFRWTMLNLGRVHIWGVESALTAATHIKQWRLTGHLTYTWQSARDVTDPSDGYYDNQIPYIPHHALSATANAAWRGLELNYAFIYTGRRWNAQENIPSNIEQPWYTSDLSLFKNFTLRRLGFRAGIEVNNIFGQDYEVIRNYPMPGRNFKATIRIEI